MQKLATFCASTRRPSTPADLHTCNMLVCQEDACSVLMSSASMKYCKAFTFTECIACSFLDPTNMASLDAIETAIFMLCLDKTEPQLSTIHDDVPFLDHPSTILAQRLLHGCGPDVNSANRWFDSNLMVRTTVVA